MQLAPRATSGSWRPVGYAYRAYLTNTFHDHRGSQPVIVKKVTLSEFCCGPKTWVIAVCSCLFQCSLRCVSQRPIFFGPMTNSMKVCSFPIDFGRMESIIEISEALECRNNKTHSGTDQYMLLRCEVTSNQLVRESNRLIRFRNSHAGSRI